jgi:hypothetical protein
MTRTLDVHTWQRLIGWGQMRPTLVLAPNTPGFSDPDAPASILRANNYAPGSGSPANTSDGSNIAFFECPLDEGEKSGRDPSTPGWIQHFAFEVQDVPTLM